MEHNFTGPELHDRHRGGADDPRPETLELVNAIEALLEDERRRRRDQARAAGVGARDRHAAAADTREAGAQLRGLRREVARPPRGAAASTIGSAGTHPFAMWEDQRISPAPRYRDLIDALRFVARQEIIFGMHVHVGVDDPDKAIHVANGMRVHVPSCSRCRPTRRSGARDATGLASTRMPIFRAFPRVGIPPPTPDWDDYERRIGFMVESGVIEDYTYLWYDVRPHPNFGTVEVRAMDAQTRVEHTLALAALIQAMVKELAEHYEAGERAGATTRTRCSTRTSGSRPATASTASSSTCPSAERVPGAGARRGGCTTACASTPRTSARRPSSRASTTSSSAATAPQRQRVVYEANHDFREVVREIVEATRLRQTFEAAVVARVESMADGQRTPTSSSSARTAARGEPVHHRVPVLRHRLRKRAPKLERGGAAPRASAPDAAAPALGRLRPRRDPRHPRRPAARTRRSRWSSSRRSSRCSCNAGLVDLAGPRAARRAARRRLVAADHDALRLRQHRLRGRRARRDLPLRLAARAPPRLVGAAAGLPRRRRRRASAWSLRGRPDRLRAAATAPRWRCWPPGSSATCSAAAAARRIEADLLGVAGDRRRARRCCRLAVERGAPAGRRSAAASPACCSASLLARLRARSADADRPGLARRRAGRRPRRPSGRRARAGPRRAGRRWSSRRTAGAGAARARAAPNVGEASRRRRGCAASRPPARARRRAARARRRSPGRRRRRPPPRARWPRASSCRWPSRPKPVTSVSACAPAARACAARAVVERRHHLDRRASTSAGVREAALDRGGDRAGAERLGEHERVAGPAAGVGEHAVGVDGAGHRHARTSARGRRSSGRRRPRRPPPPTASAPPRRISREHLGAERLERVGDEVERADRRRRPSRRRPTARWWRRCGRTRTGRRRSA